MILTYPHIILFLIIGRRDISEAFIQEGLMENLTKKKKDPAVVTKILQLCEQRKIAVKQLSKHDLNMLTDSKPHQGLVLRASCLSPTSITSLPRSNKFRYVLFV
jgi:21S rRNA (GM2251-2'-O)-methyltransferase